MKDLGASKARPIFNIFCGIFVFIGYRLSIKLSRFLNFPRLLIFSNRIRTEGSTFTKIFNTFRSNLFQIEIQTPVIKYRQCRQHNG